MKHCLLGCFHEIREKVPFSELFLSVESPKKDKKTSFFVFFLSFIRRIGPKSSRSQFFGLEGTIGRVKANFSHFRGLDG